MTSWWHKLRDSAAGVVKRIKGFFKGLLQPRSTLPGAKQKKVYQNSYLKEWDQNEFINAKELAGDAQAFFKTYKDTNLGTVPSSVVVSCFEKKTVEKKNWMEQPDIFSESLSKKRSIDVKLMKESFDPKSYFVVTGKRKGAVESFLQKMEIRTSSVKFHGDNAGLGGRRFSILFGAYVGVESRLTTFFREIVEEAVSGLSPVQEKNETAGQLREALTRALDDLQAFIVDQHKNNKILPRGASIVPIIEKQGDSFQVKLHFVDFQHALQYKEDFNEGHEIGKHIIRDEKMYDDLKEGILQGITFVSKALKDSATNEQDREDMWDIADALSGYSSEGYFADDEKDDEKDDENDEWGGRESSASTWEQYLWK